MFPNGDCHIQACMSAISPTSQNPAVNSATCISPNTWYFAAASTNQTSNTLSVYVDGQVNSISFGSENTLSANEIDIGEFESQGAMFNGYISNVQIYNTTLSSNELGAIYHEGIGGAPIDPQNLMGWWPLNGNVQDYSGNNNNGQISGGLTFTSQWLNGYSTP